MKLYVGVDVSKIKSDIYLNGKHFTIDNKPKRVLGLTKKLNKDPKQGNEIH